TLLPFTSLEFYLFIISVVFIAAAGNIINDYFDFEADKEFKPKRPLPQGALSLNAAMYLHIFFALTGITLGYYLGWAVGHTGIGHIYIVCALLLYLYSSFLKKIAFVGNILIASLTGFLFMLLLLFEVNFLRIISFDGTPYAFAILKWQVLFYGGFAFLANLAREIVKTIE